MKQDVIFKNIDGKVYIISDETLNYSTFIKSLSDRLEKLYISENLLKTNVTIDIKNIPLNSRQILNLFDVLEKHGNIYVSKIIYKDKKKKNIILHEGNIRSGENKFFNTNTLLIGNINKGGKVIVNGDLYVIGKISGDVIMKNNNSKLMASNVENAYIKICSLEKKIEGDLKNVVLRINENILHEDNFIKGESDIYGKSNCNYIW